MVKVYAGDKNVRQAMQKSLDPRNGHSGYPFDVLITTYEVSWNNWEVWGGG